MVNLIFEYLCGPQIEAAEEFSLVFGHARKAPFELRRILKTSHFGALRCFDDSTQLKWRFSWLNANENFDLASFGGTIFNRKIDHTSKFSIKNATKNHK